MRDRLTADDIHQAAQEIGCQDAAIHAVVDVESRGNGFNPDDSVVILFEGHHFSRLTSGKFDRSNPTISYPKWTRQFYAKTQLGEWRRLWEAKTLDAVAAIMSTSWGLFQIMGFNHAACGFRDAADMVTEFSKGEKQQLDGFVEFIKFNGLADELRDRRWADFARRYNGPGYAVNAYDTKLASAFKKHGGV